MKENTAPKAIHLKDYQAPDYLLSKTKLSFDLHDAETNVIACLSFYRNPDKKDFSNQLNLNGVEVELRALKLDGVELGSDKYTIENELLSLDELPDSFLLEVETAIKPDLNKALEGLYISKGMYCTQCEAHGFRRITYYPDRPDVMSEFEVRIEADKAKYPILLSNGNCVDEGNCLDSSGVDNGRHWVSWVDPHKKPCYLFALVAGDLQCVEDEFVRRSGLPVKLALYVESHDVDKCQYALDSLKRAMKWDEEVFGREYDLDIYMIVAVSHFNMGAMENKGLNIFNTSCVLAKQDTTSDAGFERVEAVVAHEYFHNWSGNRVTCRDWFQLSLKEGFTVFRDEEFSSDMGSRTVKRIDDVNILRTFQFKEDAGPMAHPVRPASYIEMNNFYTVTVYNKGAEVVRMLHTMLGAEQFRKACDTYFERHDGQAVTCDDFVAAMESVSGRDFSQFKRWYSQSGTPLVELQTEFDKDTQLYHMNFKQSCAAGHDGSAKENFVIPIRLAFFDAKGNKLKFSTDEEASVSETLLLLDEDEKTFSFKGLNDKVVASLLRGFSAPVRLNYKMSTQDLSTLLAYDDDGFSAWEAGQTLAMNTVKQLMAQHQAGQQLVVGNELPDAFKVLLNNTKIDKALLSRLLTLPSKAYIAEQNDEINVDSIVAAHNTLIDKLATACCQEFTKLYQDNQFAGEYQPDAKQVGQRSLKNICLLYMMRADAANSWQFCESQFLQADNMTDQGAALRNMLDSDDSRKDKHLQSFYQQWQAEALVIDQWFSMQVSAYGDGGVAYAEALLKHEAFDIETPNRVRAVLGALAQNFESFHRADGSGYRLLATQIARLNGINPQVAARMVSVLIHWKRFDEKRAALMKQELEALKAMPDLSKDVFEIVSKALD